MSSEGKVFKILLKNQHEKIISISTSSKSGRSSGILCQARSKNVETSTGKLRSRGGLLFLFGII